MKKECSKKKEYRKQERMRGKELDDKQEEYIYKKQRKQNRRKESRE